MGGATFQILVRKENWAQNLKGSGDDGRGDGGGETDYTDGDEKWWNSEGGLVKGNGAVMGQEDSDNLDFFNFIVTTLSAIWDNQMNQRRYERQQWRPTWILKGRNYIVSNPLWLVLYSIMTNIQCHCFLNIFRVPSKWDGMQTMGTVQTITATILQQNNRVNIT